MIISNSGQAIRYLAKFRPRMPILVITNDAVTARQLKIYSGTKVNLIYESKIEKNLFKILKNSFKYACDIGLVKASEGGRANLGLCLYDNKPLDYHDDVTTMKLLYFNY